MCGFSFIWSRKALSSELLHSVKRMNDSIVHRGPDEEGYYFVDRNRNGTAVSKLDAAAIETIKEAHMAIGFRRLAIVDLTDKGHQPMQYMDRYILAFNGEIYNYIELQEELVNKGYSFHSHTDTEVIMAAYDCWGSDCLNKFNGMWAFVLTDRLTGKVFISRDRFGVKPLYYYRDNDMILLASEIKQFLQVDGLDIRPNETRISEYYKMDTMEYGPETDFTNVYRFPEASYAVFDFDQSDANLAPVVYYQLPPAQKARVQFSPADAEKYSREYYELLRSSVRIRLRSDVPVGTCLSGGLDSTSIAYMINELFKESGEVHRQKTFSLVFRDSETAYCDESRQIESVTRLLNLESYEIEPKVNDVIAAYTQMVSHMDNIQNSSLMSYVFTYKLVRSKGVIVTLDGQGADELQGGYLTYLPHYFSNLPLGSLLAEYRSFSKNPGSRKYILRGLAFNVLRRLGLRKVTERGLKKMKVQKNPFMSVNEALREDFTTNLKTLLHYGDRGSMMNSVESRFPFLDYRMVEFWMRLPECYKLHDGYTKYLARVTFSGRLPEEIVWRREKKGWEIPQRSWLKNGLWERMKKEIESSAFVKRLGRQNVIRETGMEVKTGRSLKILIKTYNAALWHRIFFAGNG